MTKEELERLFEPGEEFSELARGLDDTTAWELLYIARNATDPEMKKDYIDRFNSRLNQIIIEGVYDSSGSSTSLLNRSNTHGSLRKIPVRRNILLVKDAAGIPSAQIVEDRSFKIESLRKLLNIDDVNSHGEQSSRTIKRARVAYLAKEKAEAGELDEFFELAKLIEVPRKEDILEELDEAGIKVKKPESIIRRSLMPDFREFADRLISLRAKAGSVAMAGVFYGFVIGLEWGSGIPVKENYATAFESYFPFVVPPDTREWRVQEKGLDSAGYYALGTASDYSNGKWEAVTRRVVNLQLPRDIADQNKLTVSRRRFINPWTDTSIKVPVKNNTKVAAVDVREVDGDEVPVHTIGLEDESVELIIPNQGFNYPWAWHVDIRADLVETSENTIKAVRGREPLDLTKLNPESLELINLARANPEVFARVLTQGIKDSHYYSIDPPGKWSLFWNRSPENRVNAIMELEGGSCIVVSEGLVLFFSNDPEGRPSALVVGYPYGVGTPASSAKDGVIRRDSSHAWGILGKDIYDPTSGVIGEDAKTKALVRQLERKQDVAPAPAATPVQNQRNEPAPEPTPEPVATATSTPMPRPTAIFRPVVEVSNNRTATSEATPTAEPTVTSTRSPEATHPRTVEPPKISDLPEPSKPWTPDLLTLGLLGGAGVGLYFLRRHLNRDPANWVSERQDGSIIFPLRENRFLVKGVYLTRDELAKAYSFLSAVSFDPFGEYSIPPVENIKAYDRTTRGLTKNPDFNSVMENTRKEWLRAYRKDPEVFDGNARGLTDKEKQKIRRLARFILEGV